MTIAHGIIGPNVAWGSWVVEPVAAVGLLAAGLAYLSGSRRPAGGIPVRRRTSFFAGLTVVGLALFSPLDHAGTEIFAAHMLQHLLLMLVAPPLIVIGRPFVAMLSALPGTARQMFLPADRSRAARALRRASASAIVVLGANAVVLWAWHLPVLYEAALSNEFIHAMEHGTFLGASLMFWNLVLGKRSRRPGNIGRTMAVVFGNLLQGAALGAILVFATSPAYPAHGSGPRMWGLTSLQDQQLAGAVMWVPTGFIYTVVMAILFLRWLRALEIADRRPEGGVVEADV